MATFGPTENAEDLQYTALKPGTLPIRIRRKLQSLNHLSHNFDANQSGLSDALLKQNASAIENSIKFLTKHGYVVAYIGPNQGYELYQAQHKPHRLAVFKTLTNPIKTEKSQSLTFQYNNLKAAAQSKQMISLHAPEKHGYSSLKRSY